jgi:hypothetical protein
VIMPPAARKLALTVHLTASVGWIGAVIAYLALGIAAVTSSEVQTVRAAWTAMDVTGWWVIVPLAFAALVTGLVMSLGTQWGLFRHYWVLISLALTLVCTVVLILHMPSVDVMARRAQTAEGDSLRALGGDLFHPGAGLLLLLAVTVLNVYKPAGLTPYGWRKQRKERRLLARQTRTGPAVPTRTTARVQEQVTRQSRVRALAGKAGNFVFYFAEMWFAMMALMLYRREHYTRPYSFGAWATQSRRRRQEIGA